MSARDGLVEFDRDRIQQAIASALDESDELWAHKMSLQARDHLHELLATKPELAGAWEAAPGTTGHVEWDVFLAALTAHAFELNGQEPPRWTRDLELDHEWLLTARPKTVCSGEPPASTARTARCAADAQPVGRAHDPHTTPGSTAGHTRCAPETRP